MGVPYQNLEGTKARGKLSKKKKILYIKHGIVATFAVIIVISLIVTLDAFRREHIVLTALYPAVGTNFTMDVFLRVQSFSPAESVMLLECSIPNSHGFTNAKGQIVQPFEVHFFGGQTQIFKYKVGQLLSSFSVNVLLRNGSINNYPFDHYSMSLDMSMNLANDYNNTEAICFNLQLESRVVSGFKIDFPSLFDKARYIAYPGSKQIRMKADRASIFIMYPVFVMLSMWMVTLVALSMSMSIVIWRKRRAELPMLIVYSGMMFALPSFRNSAPLVPPVGCLMDFASFFWTVIIAICSFVGIFVIIIIQDWPKTNPASSIPPPAPSLLYAASTTAASTDTKK